MQVITEEEPESHGFSSDNASLEEDNFDHNVHNGSDSETNIDGVDIKTWVESCYIERDFNLNLSDDEEDNDLYFDCEDFLEEDFQLKEDLQLKVFPPKNRKQNLTTRNCIQDHQ